MGTDLPAREPLLRALIDICGPDFARRAGAPDAVAGRRASFVAAPATTQAVADTMGLAAERGLAVIPRGSGSKIDWGTPPPGVDLILDTSRLDGIWNHDVRAMTAEVGAGTPLKAVQAALALRGQRLATDPPSPSATLGGMLALNETGPLRHRFGTAAHQVNHIAYVTSKGEAATSDGENGRPGIAEIDGVILSAQVHVEPLPSARRWVTAPVTSPRDIYELVQETLTRRLTPSAIEVDLSATPPSGVLAVLLEGDPPDVTDRATRLEKAFGPDATTSPLAPPWWGRYPFTPADVALRIEVPTADLQAAVYALRDVAGMPVPVRGSAGRGTVHAVLPGTLPPERVEGILDAVRGVLLARGGQCVVVAAPREIGEELDMASRHDMF
ncbi:FAD-binding oxidoreductase [Pseudosporangium ferrugineum]|uniref:Glycolate oxidase FAD binding subunit n=1 Tax=Pseudosporangium ferrugineum TaxID=439699 RepID=A0A2T0S7F6_9ACTN|nr:FAD-binding oxidoreductase [Pseudosporangium ferrugineum]PRY29325.1 glycolate oxidase FAD binding subunit [Pseudosporangium ferrugineum]